jgi:hypothetical protein
MEEKSKKAQLAKKLRGTGFNPILLETAIKSGSLKIELVREFLSCLEEEIKEKKEKIY